MTLSAGIARASLGELLAAAMPVPNEMVSEQQRDRLYHLDVEHAVTGDLERELAAVQLRLYFDPLPGGWFAERELVLRAELERRRAA